MYRTLAQKIIRENKYLTLGTTNGVRPWVAPVYYCLDKKGSMYFISQPRSRHIRDLKSHPHVAFAIFDSHAEEGKGNGVQGSGHVIELLSSALTQGLRHYCTSFVALSSEELTHGPYRLYRLQPEKMYVLDRRSKVDKRILVT